MIQNQSGNSKLK